MRANHVVKVASDKGVKQFIQRHGVRAVSCTSPGTYHILGNNNKSTSAFKSSPQSIRDMVEPHLNGARVRDVFLQTR